MGDPSVFVREFDEILLSSLAEDDEPTASSVEQVGQSLGILNLSSVSDLILIWQNRAVGRAPPPWPHQ